MAENYTRTISTAEFEDTPRVVLEQAVGDVSVQGWDRPEVQIQISDPDELFDVEQTGSIINIHSQPGNKTKFGDTWGPALEGLKDLDIGLEKVAGRIERKMQRKMRHLHQGMAKGFTINVSRWSSGLDYSIMVPHDCNVTLRTSTGDLHITGVNGVIFAQATSGDVHLNDVSGTALIKSASGDLRIDGIEGKLGSNTASGDVSILNARLRDLSVHSASGDLDLDLKQIPEGEWAIKSVSGDIELDIPRESRLTMEVKTLSGDVSCRLPHERTRLGTARGKQLVINGGGPTVRVETVSGDVNVDSSDLGAGGEDRPDRGEDRTRPEGYAQRQEAELEIFKAVERGELSAEEAMRRLSQLG